MAIIQCHECKNDISETAEVCPNCGSKTLSQIQKEHAKKSKKNLILTVIGLVFVIFIGRAIYIQKKNQEFIDSGDAAAMVEAIRSLNESTRSINKSTEEIRRFKEGRYLY